jgi:Heparan-alpha-glucosaminide N-acetyltransferase, catalytic
VATDREDAALNVAGIQHVESVNSSAAMVEKNKQSGRIQCLDLARALAVGIMLWAHWQYAAYQRIEWLGRQGWPLVVVSRLATPGFVTVFGLSVGVWLSRTEARPGGGRATRRRLVRRTGLLTLASLLITIPNWVELAWSGSTPATDYVTHIYSILVFYAIAVAALIPACQWIRRARDWELISVGVALWVLQDLLAYLLPSVPVESWWWEWMRTIFVSGQYAFLGLAGWALMMVAVGGWLRKKVEQGRMVEGLLMIGALGIALSLIGALDGVAWRELRLPQLRNALLAERAPPRFWFYSMFGGLMLIITAVVGLAARAFPQARLIWDPLAAAGRKSLPIYVGSLFVVPIVDMLQWFNGGKARLGELAVILVFLGSVAWLVIDEMRRHVVYGGRSVVVSRQPEESNPAFPTESVVAAPGDLSRLDSAT